MAIGTAISAGVGAASAIFGGIKNAREARKQRRLLKEQEAAEKAWYDREYNTDNTQRASAQRLITMTQDSIRKRNQAAARRRQQRLHANKTTMPSLRPRAISTHKAWRNVTQSNISILPTRRTSPTDGYRCLSNNKLIPQPPSKVSDKPQQRRGLLLTRWQMLKRI